ncbi:MAG: carbohydrate binding domain-containing protein [Balneolaceae bacterium]
MIKATMKYLASSVVVMLIMLSFAATTNAQNILYGENIVFNGDFSLGDSLWVTEGGNGTATFNDTLSFDVTTAGNPWEIQAFQVLTTEQIAALAGGGTWELSFDANSPDGAKTFHVFLGHNGGGWERYWASGGDGDVTVDGEMKTYTLTADITETWESMKLGFEVGADDANLNIDNIMLRKVSNNILKNGDFSLADSAWATEGGQGTVSFDNGELAFTGVTGVGNPWELQANQPFDSVQLAAISSGPYSISFDARTAEGTHDIHLFIGEVGGGWNRYLSPDGEGRITIDTEMQTYTREFAVEETWPSMRLGFEVNYEAGDVYIDNVVFTRITDVVPDAPEVSVSTDAGIVTISVTDNGAASYDVFFADTAFADITGGSLVGTIDPSTGSFSTTHTTKAPHPDYVTDFDAYYGVVARSEKGSASEMSSATINTSMTVAENYIVELGEDAVEAVSGALESGVVPDGATLAAFFPDTYKPFVIDTTSLRVEGSGAETNEDLSAKFWVGFENVSGADLFIIYAEIMDDIIMPTPTAENGGGGWNYDSWEGGFGTYEPQSIITGSDHSAFESGAEPDYQLRAGFMVAADPYIHAWDGDAGDPGYNQLVGNSQTIGDSSQTGMYRLLTVISTLEFSGVNTGAKNFDYPTGTGVTTIPFQLAVNDNDDTGRDAQRAWSSKSTSQWWNTPSDWEVVALVGADAVPTSSEEEITSPVRFSLEQNYPNPFNPSTNIQFTLPAASDVTLEVFNMLGQRVATLLQGEKMTAGSHTQKFDASNLASGMYVYRISAANFVQSRKMMLIK